MPASPIPLVPSSPHPTLEPPEHLPEVCVRCGSCCFEKVYDGAGGFINTDVPCPFLDLTTRLCTVYEERHSCKEGCVSITLEVVAEGWLPAACIYYVYFSPGPPDLRESFVTDVGAAHEGNNARSTGR